MGGLMGPVGLGRAVMGGMVAVMGYRRGRALGCRGGNLRADREHLDDEE
jgi:hypothetical protein